LFSLLYLLLLNRPERQRQPLARALLDPVLPVPLAALDHGVELAVSRAERLLLLVVVLAPQKDGAGLAKDNGGDDGVLFEVGAAQGLCARANSEQSLRRCWGPS
jgi:hypothetical protein